MSKPKVLIDGTVFEGRGRIGIWRLFYETISRTRREVDYTILLDSKAAQPVPDGVKVMPFSRGPELVSRRHVFRKLTEPFRQSRLRSRFASHLWHPTFYTLDPRGTASDPNGPKRVVTVYDMLSEDFHWMGDFSLQREIKRRCLAQSDHAICISQATEDRLLRYFPSLSGNTKVVHLAADYHGDFRMESSPAKPTQQTGLGNADPFCLFVGGRSLYKHFDFIVRSMSASNWPQDLSLTVIGRPLDEAEKQFIAAHGVEKRIRVLDAVSDSELFQLYRNAACFLFPSLGEGFGLPVLESQLNDCVPLLSDLPVFREIGGDGALYYSPHDANALIDAIVLARDPEKRTAIIAAGRKNGERFSWDKSAEKVLQCYEVLSGSAAGQVQS